MQELSIKDIDYVSGAITETQCVGAMSLMGGVIGGTLTASATYGLGTSAGWGLGFAGGAAVGMMVCAYSPWVQ